MTSDLHIVKAPYLTKDEKKAKQRERDALPHRRNRDTLGSKHYLSRPFRCWDGEGVTAESGEHLYTLLAFREGDEVYDYVANPEGLRTWEILDFVLTAPESKAVNVIYGGGYDFNMWLTDLDEEQLRRLYKGNFLRWQGFRIRWIKGKTFDVCRWHDGARVGHNVRLYDCASFFQTTFVEALDSYLGEWSWREQIVASKKARGSFTNERFSETLLYNERELILLDRLMQTLRERLEAVGLRPKRWDGPGAIASTVLHKHGIKDALAVSPAGPAQAARCAYAGGRFEILQFGHMDREVYEYDVNSAYPAALREVPNLAKGQWRHITDRDRMEQLAYRDGAFAVFKVKYARRYFEHAGALFHRNANGTVIYPMRTVGWYWAPDILAALEQARRGNADVVLLEAWHFVPDDPKDKPFAFIDPMYQQRRELKKAGDGAHVGLKLALNSLYGKLAQQTGWHPDRPDSRIPPYHQIEWAGYVTSWCRARVFIPTLDCPSDIVAFETDAVFSTKPLDVPLSSDLGDFESVHFANMTYLQSGVYFGDETSQRNGEVERIDKTRGVDRGLLHRADFLAALRQPHGKRSVAQEITRFVGAGQALQGQWAKRNRWITQVREISAEPNGKRVHSIKCVTCVDDYNSDMEGMFLDNKGAIDSESALSLGVGHYTFAPWLPSEESAEYPVAWINPNPEMTRLETLRGEERDYEFCLE